MSALLSIRKLTKRFGSITAVDGLEFEVGRGEVLGFLGPNGAGKSTTMKMISGFLAPIRGIAEKDVADAVERVIVQTRLADVVMQPIETLSKGFKRRVGLAQALVHDPEVLILAEPTDGLDPNQKHEVRGLIQGMAAEKCIIVSTHILEEVDAVCTRAMIIARGRVLADGTPADLKARSGSASLDDYFREVTGHA